MTERDGAWMARLIARFSPADIRTIVGAGRFADPAFNARIDAAAKIADASRREKAWGDLDLQLAAQVAAIALSNQKYMFVHGAGVRNYIDNPALAATVDLATVDLDTAASR